MGSLLSDARQRFFNALELADVPPESCEALKYPKETVAASIPLRRDDRTESSRHTDPARPRIGLPRRPCRTYPLERTSWLVESASKKASISRDSVS